MASWSESYKGDTHLLCQVWPALLHLGHRGHSAGQWLPLLWPIGGVLCRQECRAPYCSASSSNSVCLCVAVADRWCLCRVMSITCGTSVVLATCVMHCNARGYGEVVVNPACAHACDFVPAACSLDRSMSARLLYTNNNQSGAGVDSSAYITNSHL